MVDFRFARRAATCVGIAVVVLSLGVPSARADHPVLHTPRDVHWQNSHTLWHWGSNLNNNYPAFKTPTNKARHDTWASACCPDSQWHGHYDTSASNHINVSDCSDPGWVGCATTSYNGNAAHHMTLGRIFYDEPRVKNNKFYTDTGTPPDTKYDAWSVAAEEWGHVQNMNHFGANSCYTMYGQTTMGTTCKRWLVQRERDAAQEPYDAAHPGTSSQALAEIAFE